jgi:hypothetical protein
VERWAFTSDGRWKRGRLWGLRNRCISRLSQRLDRSLCGPRFYWLFILGVNNSGTTLLARALETHPLIQGLPEEGQLLTNALPRPDRYGVVRIWTQRMDVFRLLEEDDPYPALRAKMAWWRYYRRGGGILLEKSPPNTLRSRWLQHNFRPNKFIAVTRDPYAVCAGIKRREAYDIERAARHWSLANRCLIEDAGYLMSLMWIRYEDFVSEPELTMRRLEKFLGVDEPFETERFLMVSSHSVDGTTTGLQNLNSRNMGHLTNDEAKIITRVAEDVMSALGYPALEF